MSLIPFTLTSSHNFEGYYTVTAVFASPMKPIRSATVTNGVQDLSWVSINNGSQWRIKVSPNEGHTSGINVFFPVGTFVLKDVNTSTADTPDDKKSIAQGIDIPYTNPEVDTLEQVAPVVNGKFDVKVTLLNPAISFRLGSLRINNGKASVFVVVPDTDGKEWISTITVNDRFHGNLDLDIDKNAFKNDAGEGNLYPKYVTFGIPEIAPEIPVKYVTATRTVAIYRVPIQVWLLVALAVILAVIAAYYIYTSKM